MTDEAFFKPLTDFLKARGHSDADIKKVLEHVQNYEQKTQHDSVMDSIAAGNFSLDQIIDEALKKPD